MAGEQLDKLKKKTIPITIDGETYQVRYDLNAIEYIETESGNDIATLFAKGSKFAAANIKRLLFAGLRYDNPDITLEQAGALVDFQNAQNVFEQIMVAMSGDADEEKAGDEKNAVNRPAGES